MCFAPYVYTTILTYDTYSAIFSSHLDILSAAAAVVHLLCKVFNSQGILMFTTTTAAKTSLDITQVPLKILSSTGFEPHAFWLKASVTSYRPFHFHVSVQKLKDWSLCCIVVSKCNLHEAKAIYCTFFIEVQRITWFSSASYGCYWCFFCYQFPMLSSLKK